MISINFFGMTKLFSPSFEVGRGGEGDSIRLLKELYPQPKLDIFRGVKGYGQGDTKSVDTHVS